MAVRGGLVIEAGNAAALVSRYGAPVAEYPGCVIMPGFVNAHTHLELTDFPLWQRRLSAPPPAAGFTDWILEVIRVKRGVGMADMGLSLQNGIRTSLQSGVTAVGDILSQPELLVGFTGCRLKGRVYLELIGQDRQIFDQRLAGAVTAIGRGTAPLYPGLSPHSPYTINQDFLPEIAQVANRLKVPLSLHLAESAAELQLLDDSSGSLAERLYRLAGWQDHLQPPKKLTPTMFFDNGGLLGQGTLAVHCVQLAAKDAARLRERGVTICLCPRSNHQLDVGIAPVELFLKEQIPLCLGTDSLASNDSLSLWDEARFAIDCYKGLLTAEQLLQMATTGGAAGIGLEGEAGRLSSGMGADFQVVPLSGDFSAERLLEAGGCAVCYCGGILV